MKTTLKLFSIAALVVAATFTGCKKGEGDPFLSLSSRKARLAGEWKMKSGTTTYKTASVTVTATYDGANQNYSLTMGGGTPQTGSQAYTMNWKIEKDGTYESTTVEGSGAAAETTTQKGRWNFTGKIGEFKNKDHVVFYIDSETISNASGTSTTTYTGNDNSMVVELNTLKKKELVVKSNSTQTSGSTTTEDSAEFTFEQ